MNKNLTDPDSSKNVRRLLWSILILLAMSVAMDSYYFVRDWQYREDMALRYTFSERAQRLARDIQWDRLLQVSLDRQKSVPNDPWGYFWAGVAHFRKKDKDFDKAESFLKKALGTDSPAMRGSVDNWLQAIAQEKKRSGR